MEYSGAGGKLIHKKTRSKKSRDTVPLLRTSLDTWLIHYNHMLLGPYIKLQIRGVMYCGIKSHYFVNILWKETFRNFLFEFYLRTELNYFRFSQKNTYNASKMKTILARNSLKSPKMYTYVLDYQATTFVFLAVMKKFNSQAECLLGIFRLFWKNNSIHQYKNMSLVL